MNIEEHPNPPELIGIRFVDWDAGLTGVDADDDESGRSSKTDFLRIGPEHGASKRNIHLRIDPAAIFDAQRIGSNHRILGQTDVGDIAAVRRCPPRNPGSSATLRWR